MTRTRALESAFASASSASVRNALAALPEGATAQEVAAALKLGKKREMWAAARRRYYARNRAKVNAKDRRYYAAHREEVIARTCANVRAARAAGIRYGVPRRERRARPAQFLTLARIAQKKISSNSLTNQPPARPTNTTLRKIASTNPQTRNPTTRSRVLSTATKTVTPKKPKKPKKSKKARNKK